MTPQNTIVERGPAGTSMLACSFATSTFSSKTQYTQRVKAHILKHKTLIGLGVID